MQRKSIPVTDVRTQGPVKARLDPLAARTLFAFGMICSAASVGAATITVDVPGPLDPANQVGCALFSDARGFPDDPRQAHTLWQPANAAGVQCVFPDVAEGAYAISVMIDANGNRRLDSNLVGMPTEAWGVSNNVRPSLRAPRFEEALIRVTRENPLSLTIRPAR